MVNSMTGFASLRGDFGPWSWVWDMRAVNSRGLDLRLRLPDWIEGLDAKVRAAIGKSITRGNVTLGLKLSRDAADVTEKINADILERALGYMVQIEEAAMGAGLSLAPATPADVLGLKGVLVSDISDDDPAPLAKALVAQIPELMKEFNEMRGVEGAALADVLNKQLDHIEALTAQSVTLAQARNDATAEKLRKNLARVLDNSEGADEARVAQELAMIAVKTDVTEEIDRLGAHVTAARDLLASDQAIGRKLDFLSQEFNREANTLCSKAQSSALTSVGLDLKATIDQMREQVQNVE